MLSEFKVASMHHFGTPALHTSINSRPEEIEACLASGCMLWEEPLEGREAYWLCIGNTALAESEIDTDSGLPLSAAR